MPELIDIYRLTSEYLAGRQSLRSLEEWVAVRLPAFLSQPDSSSSQLVGALELALAELGAGEINEDDVRRLLAAALGEMQTIHVVLEASPQFRTSSNSVAVSGHRAFSIAWPTACMPTRL